MTDPIEKLAEIFPNLENGQKMVIKGVKENILEMRATIADLESTLARQPLPEAPASINVRVVDPISQMEYQVTIREARAGLALIGRIPEIGAALADLGLVAMDTYIDERRADRGQQSTLPTPDPRYPTPIPMCPDGHGAMKASTKVDGEFYCSHSVGVHPQTQKKLYCMHKVKA